MKAFIGLGSNVGDRPENLKHALALLSSDSIAIIRVSSVYETDPVGPPQPNFLNAACLVETALDPRSLVTELKRIEVVMGREEGDKWGPRLIDLDLLLYGDLVINEDGLIVPHPELTKRAFVLVPLLEIDPDAELPSGEPVSAFLEKNPSGIKLFA